MRRRLGAWLDLSAAVMLVVLVTAGCNMTKLAAKQTVGVFMAATPSFESETDIELADAAMAANLKMFEGLMLSTGPDKRLLEATSMAFGSYAFGFIDVKIESIDDPNDPTRMKLVKRSLNFYSRGMRYAEELLTMRDKELVAKLHSDPATVKAALAETKEKMVPGLFWMSYNWANKINLQLDNPPPIATADDGDDGGEIAVDDAGAADDGERLPEEGLDAVKLILERIIELDETFYNGAAHSALGVIHGSVPPALGGNPDDALKAFDRNMELTDGKFLLVHVFKAQYWATNAGDAAAFDKLLDEVINAPDDLWPEQALANALAKERAIALKARRDEYFPSEVPETEAPAVTEAPAKK